LGKIEDEKEALDWNNKGNVLKKLGRDEEAEQCFANVKRLQK
jgi:uncharacterized protein HemY